MLKNALMSSLFISNISAFFSFISRIITKSFTWGFFARPERLSFAFEKSRIGSLAILLFQKYTNLLRRCGAFLDRLLRNTLSLWLVKWLGERFYVLFYVFIAMHSLLAYEYYRNPITVVATALFLVSFSTRVAFDTGATSSDTGAFSPYTEAQSASGATPSDTGALSSDTDDPSATVAASSVTVAASSVTGVKPSVSGASFDLKRTDIVFLFYSVTILFSAVYSLFGPGSGSASTTTAILYLCSILLAFIIANSFTDVKRLLQLIKIIVLSTFVMSIYGLVQFVNRVPVDMSQVDQTTGGASLAMGRVSSTLGNPNVFAGWLVLVIPFIVSLFFIAKNFRKKLLYLIISLSAIACLAFTLSRSGWIGVFAAAVVYLFLLNWRLIPAFTVLGVACLPFVPRFIIDRLMITGNDTSSIYRLSIWAGSFRMALDNWLTGIGIGLEFFKRFFNNYVYTAYDQAPVHSHMLVLQIWLESGLAAAFAFIWFFLRLIKKGLRAAMSGRDDHSYILKACISSFAGFMALGAFEYTWFFPRCMNMFFIITGVFMSALSIAPNASNASNAPNASNASNARS